MADYQGQRARELIAARKAEDSFSTMDRVMSHLKRQTREKKQDFEVRLSSSVHMFLTVRPSEKSNLSLDSQTFNNGSQPLVLNFYH